MAVIKLEQNRKNLHGHFSRDLEPIAVVGDGDRLICNVMDGDWHLSKPTIPETGAGEFFSPKDQLLDAGHALIGPIYVEGTEPGMTLAIRINAVRPSSWGWSRVGGTISDHTRRLGIESMPEYFLLWDIDVDKSIAKSHEGHVVKLNPFLGVLGVAPYEAGQHSTHPPRYSGGNFDCKSLVVGSTLYLPISVKGSLFSLGDGHAAQGDGELGGTAIECPMDLIDLTFSIEKKMIVVHPRANTPEGWITFGFHEDLTEAMYIALNEMTSLIQELFSVSQKEALAITSLVVDARITQIVNGVRGVHAVLPHGSIYKCHGF